MELFNKDIEPRCVYCSRGRNLGGGETICAKRGVVSEGDNCRHFKYDPLKRCPPKPAKLMRNYTPEDFKI